jgi:hypothetical protein
MKKAIYILLVVVPFFSLGWYKGNDSINASPLTPEEALTANPWRMKEIRFLQNNVSYFYKRGATRGNNMNFDKDVVTFKADHTGTYASDNSTYSFIWNFTDAGKTKITMVIAYPDPLTVHWENITYTGRSLNYTEYYKRDKTNSLGVGCRIP